MINPLQNQHLAKQHFESEQCDAASKKYYNGLTYKIPATFLGRFTNAIFNHDHYMEQLSLFYPYQEYIQQLQKQRSNEKKNIYLYSLFSSAALMFGIFNYAKRGEVNAALRQYGRFIQSHRLFRHYLWACIGPYVLLKLQFHKYHMNNMEVCWQVHANRLNGKDLSDPDNTIYPSSLNQSYY